MMIISDNYCRPVIVLKDACHVLKYQGESIRIYFQDEIKGKNICHGGGMQLQLCSFLPALTIC